MLNWFVSLSVTAQAAIVAAVVGAITAGIVAEYRQALQFRRDARRTLNSVLFTQLEILHRVKRSSPEPALQFVKQFMESRYGVDLKDTFEALFAHPEMQHAVYRIVGLDSLDAIENRYSEAVAAVAQVNPILAYRLYGGPAIGKYREQVQSYFDAATTAAVTHIGAPAPSSWNSLSRLLEAEVRDQLIADLVHDTQSVARTLGWITLWRVRRILRKPLLPPDRETSELVNKLVSQVEALLSPSGQSAV